MNFGACWLTKNNSKKRSRLRRSSYLPQSGDIVELFYSPKILESNIKEPKVIWEHKTWGVWYKPAGVLTQGTNFGDGLSIERIVEKEKGKSFIVHRLDKETDGLIMIAYTKKMANILSDLFKRREVEKTYQAVVKGITQDSGIIDKKIEGKKAITHYKKLFSNKEDSTLEVQIKTGRFHQIRKHLNSINHPIIGDSKYGKNNKNQCGLKLTCKKLKLNEKIMNFPTSFEIPNEYI